MGIIIDGYHDSKLWSSIIKERKSLGPGNIEALFGGVEEEPESEENEDELEQPAAKRSKK